MSDLIDRLRNYQDGNTDLMEAAADEIKRLRSALAQIYTWYPISVSQPRETISEMQEFALNSLEGK